MQRFFPKNQQNLICVLCQLRHKAISIALTTRRSTHAWMTAGILKLSYGIALHVFAFTANCISTPIACSRSVIIFRNRSRARGYLGNCTRQTSYDFISMPLRTIFSKNAHTASKMYAWNGTCTLRLTVWSLGKAVVIMSASASGHHVTASLIESATLVHRPCAHRVKLCKSFSANNVFTQS